MLKILLVYDDFQELTSVELMLKKIGFDVVGITSEFSLAEQLLSFNPQVVVAQGRTAKVSTANVGRRLRESVRWDGQSVLVFYPNAKPQATELLKIRMDVGLEYPVEPTKMVQVLAQLGSLDSNQLLDKLIKNISQESATATQNAVQNAARSESQSVYVSGGQKDNSAQKTLGGAAVVEAKKSNVLGEGNEPNHAPKALSGSFDSTSDKQSIGGPDSGLDSRNALNSGGLNSESNQSLKGLDLPMASNEEVKGSGVSHSQAPLFPLSGKGESVDSQGVDGKVGTNSDSVGVGGLFGEINPFQLDGMAQDPLMQELENLLQKKTDLSITPPIKDPARAKKYEEYMKTIPIQQMSSIKRREAKLRLKDLIKDIDKDSLEDQDVLRREYVKALFKKEG